MAEYGILYRDEMVRALRRPVGDPLRKSVTRRKSNRWAKVKPGDLLWVRECWTPTAEGCWQPYLYRAEFGPELEQARKDGRLTLLDLGAEEDRWRPSMAMPRRASRMTHRVLNVRREQAMPGLMPVRLDLADVWQHTGFLADRRFKVLPPPLPFVDDEEARREGVADRAAYLALWESINGPVYPEAVWRIEFEEVSRG